MTKNIKHRLGFFRIVFIVGTVVTGGNYFVGIIAGILISGAVND